MKKLFRYLFARLGYRLVSTDIPTNDGYLDRPEFQYILWLDRIYAKIAQVPGNIVEIGVARGRNSIIFGRLIQLHGEQAVRHYYGFDTFDGYARKDIEENKHLTADAFKGIAYNAVVARVADAGLADVSYLIKGDIREQASRFVESGGANFQPGLLKVALLYIDCNAFDPALFSMRFFLRFMADGGVICIDEKMQGGETRALDAFCAEKRLRVVRDRGPFGIPAYTIIGHGQDGS